MHWEALLKANFEAVPMSIPIIALSFVYQVFIQSPDSKMKILSELIVFLVLAECGAGSLHRS